MSKIIVGFPRQVKCSFCGEMHVVTCKLNGTEIAICKHPKCAEHFYKLLYDFLCKNNRKGAGGAE